MAAQKEYLVRFGRLDGSAIKTVFFTSKEKAFNLANSLSYVFWYRHDFKRSDFAQGDLRMEQDQFFIELKEKIHVKDS